MRALDDIALLELIPQRPPFVMIDRFVSCDQKFATTSLEVGEENILVAEGCLTAAGLMENIAQTCAVRIGYLNEGMKIGVVGSVNNFEIFRTPKIGERIVTTIEVLEEVFQITLVNAIIHCGEETIAQANMKVALLDVDAKE